MMKPNISIVMLTYYHEKYISQAIESILQQKTNCTYELIIADDCSKDRTREIINEYVRRYPDIIKPIFNTENVGITKNIFNAISFCTGDYITFLSGDDYWINYHRLDIQFNFLQQHREYIAVTGITEARMNGEILISISPERKMVNKDITLKEYLKGKTFDTHAVMLRNIYIEAGGHDYLYNIVKFSPFIDDSTLCILILNKGPAYTLPYHFCVYRIIKGNQEAKNYNSTNNIFQKAKKEIDLYNNMSSEFGDIDLTYLYARGLSVAALATLLTHKFSDFDYLYQSLPEKYKRNKIKFYTFLNIFKIGTRVCMSKLRAFVKRGYKRNASN